jgi:hypothetical protein
MNSKKSECDYLEKESVENFTQEFELYRSNELPSFQENSVNKI